MQALLKSPQTPQIADKTQQRRCQTAGPIAICKPCLCAGNCIILVFYDCVTNYHKLSHLKLHAFMMSLLLQIRFLSMAEVGKLLCATIKMWSSYGLQSRCWLNCNSSEGLMGEGSVSRFTEVVGNIYFVVVHGFWPAVDWRPHSHHRGQRLIVPHHVGFLNIAAYLTSQPGESLCNCSEVVV